MASVYAALVALLTILAGLVMAFVKGKKVEREYHEAKQAEALDDALKTKRDVESGVDRESDPVGKLRDEWSRD